MLGNCSRFLNFTTPSWTPLASSLEIAVQEFGWLGDNVSPAMTIALPPVPNVVGAFGWFTAVFSVKMWKECKAKKTCQLKQPPPFWVQPPLRVLPQLTEIGEEEAWERMHYWGAVILLSPLLMAFLCEAMRWCFACAKRRISPGGKSSTASIASGTYRSLQMEESMPDLEKPFTETVETPPEPDHPSGCCCMLWIYHAMCAGLVAVGLLNGWISGAFGGGVAWELWVIWQQICLWNLFLQNLARCVMQDETALHASTVTSVLFYTTPFLSEVADSMKDWVVTGICICHAQRNLIGFTVGCGLLGLEAFALALGAVAVGGALHRVTVKISERTRISPPAMLLQALYATFLVTRIPIWALACIAGWLFACTGARERPVLIFLLPTSLLVLGLVQWLRSLHITYADTAFWFLADGRLLAVISAYAILYSHFLAVLHEDSAKDLCKTFKAIRYLPLKPPSSFPEGLVDKIARQVGNLCVDFLSSSRLLLAWSKDLPEAIIALVLLFQSATDQPGLGLIGYSAIISIVKSLLIPSCQHLLLSQRKAAFQQALVALVRSNESVELLLRDLQPSTSTKPTASSALSVEQTKQKLQVLLSEASRHLLSELNLGDAERFKAFHLSREKWLSQVVTSEDGERIRGRLVASYVETGISANELFDLGHMTGNCKLVGFTALECKLIARFSAKQCKDAGFLVSDCLGAGYTTKEIKAADFSARDWKDASFTANQCKDAGFSAKECADAGFSFQDCLEAGFSVDQCNEAGFAAALCMSAGFSVRDCKDAGFSAKQCKDAGSSAKDCKDAGFTSSECKVAGFSSTDCKDAGFSAKQCKDAGFSGLDCKEAGFSAKQCRDAGFSAKQCKDATFSVDECKMAGFSVLDCKDAGFSAKQCREAGFSAGDCNDSGFSAEECKQAGFSAKDCKDAGFSAKECRVAGFSATDCKNAGFSAKDCADAGFSLQDCRDAGFSADQCKEGGFSAGAYKRSGSTVKDCMDAGFSTEQCNDAGFSAMDYKNSGYSAKQCKDAGFCAKDCKDAGFSARECKLAGFSVIDCKGAGFSAEQCQEAGFSARDCKDSGFSAEECKEADFSAKECVDAGFSFEDCRDAGFTIEDLDWDPL
ncbi:unnamed protein product [Durusdinium trenchii]|uniref:Uncharacterized protein n=1 Tax=Durusdinium trenchii TaxID=1381693 RepID=A0ABP0NGB0_9DINO